MTTTNGKMNGHHNGHHTTVIKTSTQPNDVLHALGLTGGLNEGLVSDAQVKLKGDIIDTYCPSTGKVLGQVQTVSYYYPHRSIIASLLKPDYLHLRTSQVHASAVPEIVDSAHEAYKKWRQVPAPKRGEILREIRNELYENKKELGALISLEMGKILQEGIGEVQEAIDICDCELSHLLLPIHVPKEFRADEGYHLVVCSQMLLDS